MKGKKPGSLWCVPFWLVLTCELYLPNDFGAGAIGPIEISHLDEIDANVAAAFSYAT